MNTEQNSHFTKFSRLFLVFGVAMISLVIFGQSAFATAPTISVSAITPTGSAIQKSITAIVIDSDSQVVYGGYFLTDDACDLPAFRNANSHGTVSEFMSGVAVNIEGEDNNDKYFCFFVVYSFFEDPVFEKSEQISEIRDVVSAAAAAVPVVPNDWELKPASIRRGQQFRLLVITESKRDAAATSTDTSTDMDAYNTFVQTDVNNGHAAIRQYHSDFRVLGSTATVSARVNTYTTGAGVPIYWLNGEKVADDYADFYDNNGWDSRAATHADGGMMNGANRNVGLHELALMPFTGSTRGGEIDTGHSFGSPWVRLGNLHHNNPRGVIQSIIAEGSKARKMFYALSPVFEVE